MDDETIKMIESTLHQRTYAMIMYDNPFKLSKKSLKKVIKKDWPELEKLTEFKEEKLYFRFNIGDYKLFIQNIDKPILWKDLDHACETTYYWENPIKEVKNHTKHLLVFVESEKKRSVETYIILTKIIRSIINLINAIGVYWRLSLQVFPTLQFTQFSDIIKEGQLPVPIWIKVSGGEIDNNVSNFYTTGMAYFYQEEIEIIKTTKKFSYVLPFLLDLTDTLIKQGSYIKDGDNIEGNDGEQINVRFLPSEIFDNKEKSMRLFLK
ncbi:MAG: DUF4261 domain-containing protein [Candidatus Lokiarchaeota archaeon]|nr:DUF4261 domain-containing protein [Candidatus Lokiarchaeota archaeon]